ncbi:MAG: hypothetical protein M3410_05915 [Acidobacteriota bacterium]|nr:hypothetical protein [Acidobacteriota bacterium]
MRYYGLWSPACREQLEQARTLLGPVTIADTTAAAGAASAVDTVPDSSLIEPAAPVPAIARCPHCYLGQLFEVRVLPPLRKVPP